MTCPGIPNLKNSMILEEIKRELMVIVSSFQDEDDREEYSHGVYDGETGLAAKLLESYFDIILSYGRFYLNLYRGDTLQDGDEVKLGHNSPWSPIYPSYFGRVLSDIDFENKEQRYRRLLR